MSRFKNNRWYFTPTVIGVVLAVYLCRPVVGDELTIKREGQATTLTGKVVVEAQDGGLLFKSNEGRLWMIKPDEIENVVRDEEPFKSLDIEQFSAQLRQTLPEGFEIYRSDHFLVCYDTSEAYARWVSGLFERLYDGYFDYWRKKKLELSQPDGPLVVMVFKDEANYQRYLAGELGQKIPSMVAYYNLMSNRVALFDLTRTQLDSGDQELNRFTQINRVLSSDQAGPMVATVVHEATHQLIFNSGLQTRFAESPLWLNEGMAIYFETPDLSSKRGWRGIGKLNKPRLIQFRQALSSGKAISLAEMIGTDKPFRDTETGADAYAGAWAFNYFLLRRKPKQYVSYLTHMSGKQPLQPDSAEQRVADFMQFFDEDIEQLQNEFVRYAKKLR